jgi:DNA polymerase III delta subunit
MVEKNIYLFVGGDNVSKDRKITALKKEALDENNHFDYESLYAGSLTNQRLKELLYSLPALSKKRIVVIKEIDKLSLPNKRILLVFAKKISQDTLLVLDTDKPEIKDAFIQQISHFAKVFYFASAPVLNVFDLGRAIARKKSKDALLCLARLLKNGEKQSNILGVIGWQWRKLRTELPEQEFIKGLELLREADFNIKRSRLKGDLALELLVVKLCAPISC